MYAHTEIPVETTSPPATFKPTPPTRRHRTRYYAHRVKESLTTRVSKFLCSIFLGLLLVLGLIAFILWLGLRPHRPRFHVVALSVPGVNQENGFQNAAVTFNATARNPNLNVEIHYEAMVATLFYRDQQIASLPLLNSLHQPTKNTTYLNGVFFGASLSVTDDSWRQFMAAGTVVLRLELTSGIHFKIAAWTTNRHRMHVSCDVGVGSDGLIAPTYKGRRCSTYFD